MAENSGMISPQQLAVKAQEAKLALEAQAQFIRDASQDMVTASESRSQFIPGTQETPVTLLAKQNAALESQQKKQEIKKATDFDRLSIVLGQDLAAMANEQRAITQKIKEDSSVSLFDDPLLALANAFTLPWDEQALRGVTTKIDTTRKAMESINTHVQNSAKTVDATEEAITAAGVADTSTAIETLFKMKSADARIKAAQLNGQAIEQILRLDGVAADAYMKSRQMADMEENRRLRADQAARQNKIFDAQMQKITDEKESEAIMLRLANSALRAEGKNTLDISRFKLYKATSAAFLDTLVRKGMDLEINGRENFSHGATIDERFAYQQTLNWQPDPNKPQQEKVMLWQLEARNAAVVGTAGTGKEKSKAAGQNAEVAFGTRWKTEQQNISEGSPFRAPAYEVFAKHSPQIVSNPIWQKYIAPTLTSETALKQAVNEKVVLDAAVQAVLNKEMNSADAAAFVKSVFTTSVNLNNRLFEFKKIADREQTAYGVRLKAGNMFSGKSYNLIDETEVTAALTQQITNQMISLGRFGISDYNQVGNR
jgi:PIN domain nuclease of toxin-antitoxin system